VRRVCLGARFAASFRSTAFVSHAQWTVEGAKPRFGFRTTQRQKTGVTITYDLLLALGSARRASRRQAQGAKVRRIMHPHRTS
jgi:hypothetical protein